MSPEEEFEFEFDDDEEKEEEKPKGKKGTSKKTSSSKKTARRMPLSEGVKKRLLKNMKDITKLKDELESCTDEKESFEREFELLEDELENLRSDNDKVTGDMNQKVATINALEKKLDRNQKDFDNFKNRNKTDLERQVKMGSKKIILGIIDVLDNLDRALAEARKSGWKSGVKQIIEGVESTKKGLIKLLNDNGVEIIDPLDEEFDPNYHEAIGMETERSKLENTVISVESKGYLLGGIVLMAAKVIISKGGKARPKNKDKGNGNKTSSKTRSDEEVENIEEEEDEIEELDELMDELDKVEDE